MLFRCTLLLGIIAAGGGLSLHLLQLAGLNWPFTLDLGTARIIVGCGIGLIATARVFFKNKPASAGVPGQTGD